MALGLALIFLGPALMGRRLDEADPEQVLKSGYLLVFVGMAVMLLTLPWVLARIKRYQHDHYAWAGEQTRFSAGVGAFYLWALKLAGMGVAVVAGLGALTFAAGHSMDAEAHKLWFVLVPFVVTMGLYLLAWLLIYPWGVTRLQNLVWNATASDQLRFESRLTLGPMMRLHLVNSVLTLLTLSLYRPFAAIAMARLRLESVALHAASDPAEWAAGVDASGADAAGEAAGDFFGFDIGL